MHFDYGDEVQVSSANGGIPGKAGSVDGVTPVETEEQAVRVAAPIGTVLYTVEFGEGSDALVPNPT